MVRFVIIFFAFVILTGCASSTKSKSDRGLMLMDIRDLPRNAKFASPKYQQKLKKSMKQHQRSTKRSYKRSGK